MEFAEGVEGKEDKDGPRDAEMLGNMVIWNFPDFHETKR